MRQTNNDNMPVYKFLNFLNEEYNYLTRIKIFLGKVPAMIMSGEINQVEFQNFLEKYELENSRFVFDKNRYREEIGGCLSMPAQAVTFKVLVSRGFREFENIGRRVLRIANEIKMLLVKITVYMKNFARMQQEFQRLNAFILQSDYSARGAEANYNYNPGKNLQLEV